MADNNLTTGQSSQEPVTPKDSPYDSPFSEFKNQTEESQPTQPEEKIEPEANTIFDNLPTTPPAATPPQYQTLHPEPETETSIETPPETKRQNPPAVLPTDDGGKKTSSITTLVLAVLAILAVAGAALLFLRSQFLKTQLTNLISTKQNQQTTEASPTPEPTTEPAKVPQTTVSPTPANTIAPQATYPYLPEAIKIADDYAKNNQLLMITADNVQSPYQIQIKYWFRTADENDNKKYFYILHQPAEDLSLFDKQIYVTPDNDIPDLKAKAIDKILGLDLNQALKVAKEKVLDNSSIESSPDSIFAQYIDTNNTLLWQLVYNYTDRATPIVIQVNANTQEIIYSNINYNK